MKIKETKSKYFGWRCDKTSDGYSVSSYSADNHPKCSNSRCYNCMTKVERENALGCTARHRKSYPTVIESAKGGLRQHSSHKAYIVVFSIGKGGKNFGRALDILA